MISVSSKDILSFQNHILDWYAEHKRELPRREIQNPYYILVSEVMSQQTQVSRVIPKYHAFIEKFPTWSDLAGASQVEVLRLRSGLGYNNRAIRLQKTAGIIARDYSGVLPRNEKELLQLPGIGPYTAHALLAFVYNEEVPVLDINIRRVICSRFSFDPALPDKQLRAVASTLIPSGDSRTWHNALMDYGALVLTSKRTGIASAPQSTFFGSRRRVRGSVLKHLLHHGNTTLSALAVKFPHQEFRDIVLSMQKEGLIHIENDMISVQQ